jgi:hypothetical protein
MHDLPRLVYADTPRSRPKQKAAHFAVSFGMFSRHTCGKLVILVFFASLAMHIVQKEDQMQLARSGTAVGTSPSLPARKSESITAEVDPINQVSRLPP